MGTFGCIHLRSLLVDKRGDIIRYAWNSGSGLVWRFQCGHHQHLGIGGRLGHHHPIGFPVMRDIITSVVSSMVATCEPLSACNVIGTAKKPNV